MYAIKLDRTDYVRSVNFRKGYVLACGKDDAATFSEDEARELLSRIRHMERDRGLPRGFVIKL